MAEFLQILSEEWAIRALIASSLVGLMCGVIGTFMVLRNMSLIGDAISHAILPGIFFAFVIVGYSSIGFFAGTLLAALVSAIAITWVQDNVKTKNDAAIGIIFTFMFSIGVIGISYLNNQQGVHLDLKDFLFGTILGISDEDLIITGMVAIYAIGSIVLFYRYLFITTFQPTIASTMGISVKMMHYFLMLLLSFAVVASLRTVGIILVVAMLITPSATALLLSKQLKHVLIISGLVGLLSAIIGLVLAIVFDTTPGPAMCVVVTAFYFIAVFFSPSKGLVFRWSRRRQQSAQIEKEDILKYLSKKYSESASKALDISERLGISKNRIGRRLTSLKQEGFVLDADGQYQLTVKGRNRAEALVRAHRLWETFLVDEVGLDNQEIHDDAEKYEHLLDQDFIDRLDSKLGYPTLDPHGSPIPAKVVTPKLSMLSLKPKSKGTISAEQISDQVESRLWELGLSPSTKFQISTISTESVTIIHGGEKIPIPADLAAQINVN
ncbi:MAG: iron chelate uptake ABC transporter family permease subunit [Bacteroidota bacterium]